MKTIYTDPERRRKVQANVLAALVTACKYDLSGEQMMRLMDDPDFAEKAIKPEHKEELYRLTDRVIELQKRKRL